MSDFLPSSEECARHTIFPGVRIRTCASAKMMLALADLEPQAIVAEHSHPHEQVGMVLEGRADFTIGDERKILGPGDFYRIPGPRPPIVGAQPHFPLSTVTSVSGATFNIT